MVVVAVVMARFLAELQRFKGVSGGRALASFKCWAFMMRVVQMFEHKAAFRTIRAVRQNRFLVAIRLIFVLTFGLCSGKKKQFNLAESIKRRLIMTMLIIKASILVPSWLCVSFDEWWWCVWPDVCVPSAACGESACVWPSCGWSVAFFVQFFSLLWSCPWCGTE